MSYHQKQQRNRGRGGSRGRNQRPTGSSSPPQPSTQFSNFEDGFGNTDIYANKAMVYYVTSNLGEVARIVVRNGDIYEGVLKAVSPKFDCTLGEAHLIAKQTNGLIEDGRIVPSRESLISTLLIALKDIVSVNITKTEEPDIASITDSFTDAAITASKQTNGQTMERPLQKWVPQDGEVHLGRGLEDDMHVNGWSADEMFKTNREKFGVTSTYTDDLHQYTTPLPKDSSGEMELKAEQTAREIEESWGHNRRQEVDSGRSEEEAFAAVVRPQTTAPASQPTDSPPVTVTATDRQDVASNTATITTAPEATSTTTTVTTSSAVTSRVTSQSKVPVSEDLLARSSLKEPVQTEAPKSQQEVVKDLKDFHTNFKLGEKPSKKAHKEGHKEVSKAVVKEVAAEPEAVESAVARTSETPPAEVAKAEDSKTPQPQEESILSKSKLNPLAKEFKFTPKPQKPAPSPQPSPHYVPMVATQPFSPTSMRPPPIPGAPFPQQLMMVSPQQINMYRGKQPFHKPRSQTYPGREQGESPPFISAAAATGSPIIAPGGTFPQPVYPVPAPQVAYVQSPAGMVPQQVVPQFVAVPTGHGPPRYMHPGAVSSPVGGGSVPMSQAYQDGSHMPVYVTGNMPTAATPPGQPQPSPSQQGQQFIFTGAVPQLPGQPQGAGPHQAQTTPGPAQFPQPVMYIQGATVPTSAASAPVYGIPGNYPGDRIQ